MVAGSIFKGTILIPTYLLESSPRQPYGFAANISVPTVSIGWQVAEISPSFNTPPLAVLNHDIWP